MDDPSAVMRRALYVVTAFIVLICLSLFGIHFRAHSKIGQHEREVSARVLECESMTRPPLFGSALPGNATELHWQAVSAIAAMPETEVPRPDLIAPFKVALRRRQVSGPGTLPFMDLEKVRTLLEAGAEHHHLGGRDAAAFEWLTIHLGVVQDTLILTPWLYNGEWEIAQQGLAFLAEHSLSAAELEEIARRLDALSLARPTLSQLIRWQDAIERGHALQGERRNSTGDLRLIPAQARHFWLPSVARAAALQEIAAYYRRLEAAQALPPTERIQAAQQDGLPWSPGHSFGDNFRADARALTLRAILRAAVAVAWHAEKTGRVPEKLSDIPGFIPDAATAGLWSYSAGVFTFPWESKSWPVRRR